MTSSFNYNDFDIDGKLKYHTFLLKYIVFSQDYTNLCSCFENAVSHPSLKGVKMA